MRDHWTSQYVRPTSLSSACFLIPYITRLVNTDGVFVGSCGNELHCCGCGIAEGFVLRTTHTHTHTHTHIHTHGWLIEWLAGWLSDWMTGWVTSWLIEWLVGWLTVWLTGWLVEWIAGWLTGWVTSWLIEWLFGWLTVCLRRTYFLLSSRFIGWPINSSYFIKP